MADSGSDTETDDELFEHFGRLQSHEDDAPASPLHSEPAAIPQDAVEAANQPVAVTETVAITETGAAQPASQANAAPETAPVLAALSTLPAMAAQINSDDDEPPRRQEITAPTPRKARNSAPSTVRTVALPSLSIFQPKSLPPVQIGTSTSAAVSAAAAIAKRAREQQEVVKQPPATVRPPPTHVHHSQALTPLSVATRQPSMAPVASVAQPSRLPVPASVGQPASTQFKSPFLSLATQYRPPPVPVMGAPAASYVPLRAPPVYGGPPASYTPIPPMHRTPTIPCTTCTKVLPENASPIPLGGHGACSCCGRYYPSLLVRESRQFCTACVPQASAASRPAPPSTVSAPSRVYPTCGKCLRPLTLYPPEEGKGKQCQCCLVWYANHTFSRKQSRLQAAKCGSCVVGQQRRVEAQQQQAKYDKKHEKILRRKAERLAEKKKETEAKNKAAREAAALRKNAAQTATAGTSAASASTDATPASGEAVPPPEVSQAAPQERHEMEIEVRNIKLARQSIHRRRKANDLRGSTRLEYEAQLGMQEDSLNQKMVRLRRRNPVLFDWVNQGLEIKGALGIAPSERDHPVKGKQQKQKRKQKPKQKPPAKKRKDSSAPISAKRARVTEPSRPAVAASSVDTKHVKPEVKTEASSVGGISSYDTAGPVAARARRAKPIEIIDLVDSD